MEVAGVKFIVGAIECQRCEFLGSFLGVSDCYMINTSVIATLVANAVK